MNAPIFRRLVWKEYRTQRAFWIAMFAPTIFAELLLLASASMVHDLRWAVDGSQRVIWMFGFALAFPAFYALGCGATLFAAEHDADTYPFLRDLPVDGFSIFLSKILLALLATASLACILFFPAYFLAGLFYERVALIPWVVWFLV